MYLLSVCIQENKVGSEIGHNLMMINLPQKKYKTNTLQPHMLTSFLRLIDILKIAVEASKTCWHEMTSLLKRCQS